MDTQRHQARVRVAAVIVQDGGILLVRHVKGDDTYWLLPGGGVEFGEALHEALAREVREETGLDVDPGDLIALSDSISPGAERHIVNLYFLAERRAGELRPSEDARVAEARFVPVDELAALRLYPDIREALLDAVREGFPRRAPYLGAGWRVD